MTRIASAASLLHAALQDIHAGKVAQAARLETLSAQVADTRLAALIGEEATRTAAQAARLAGTGIDTSGPRNLWMAGVLDDADRDARSTERGRLLDIALIGAIRKGKAAEIVASETAIALARVLDQPAMLAAVETNRAEEIATDRALAERLGAIVGAR